ncbi:hypothetical protein BESB_034800 [Besnoitia besnoiti]|uniref:CRAL-TRIO domain-containing protein n=1 Tax=Besnoitia besnoiti TaxID=94643 RepID=A0A2A9MN38_BESBE|nr:hypothetical protein BESB_034800 [Besnoitia besnoiti]PFH37022.1 hypothetical protein BESB_034800 [Besnoitia besnoiti]
MRPSLRGGWLYPLLFALILLALAHGARVEPDVGSGSLLHVSGVEASAQATSVADVRRFVENYRVLKRIIPHYYASFTHTGDIIYFLGLNGLDMSVLESNKKVTQLDMEQHLHFVRQIVWDCLISFDSQPIMYMVVDLRGLQVVNAWSKRNRMLTQLLRAIRDKTFTRRFHRVQVAAISESRIARTIVEMKRHKFPVGTDVQVYPSFSAFIEQNKDITADVLPRAFGGSADVELPNGGLEYMISFFVEEILARRPAALYECYEARGLNAAGK